MTENTSQVKDWENTTPKWVGCTYSDSGWAIMEEFFPNKVLPDHVWLKLVENSHPKVPYRVYHKLRMHGWTTPRIDDLKFDTSDAKKNNSPIWVVYFCSESGLKKMEEEFGKTLRCDWWDALIQKGDPAVSFRMYHRLKKNGWIVKAVDDPGFD
jgi:hypothetical protein